MIIGLQSMNWPQVRFEDVALPVKGSIVSGPFGSNIGSRFFVDDGVPVIRGNNLTFGHRRFVDDGFVFLTDEKAEEFKNCQAIEGDLVFTRLEPSVRLGLFLLGPALIGTSFQISSFVSGATKAKSIRYSSSFGLPRQE